MDVINGLPRVGKSAFLEGELRPIKQRVCLLFPYGSLLPADLVPGETTDGLTALETLTVTDEHVAAADVEVRMYISIQEAEDADKYLRAAELLGFRAVYTNDPTDQENGPLIALSCAGRTY